MFNRKKTLHIIIPALILAAFTSCKKSELTSFDQQAMVHFYKLFTDAQKDSVLYTFAVKPASLVQDTVKLPVRIAGKAADKDRVINLKAVADSTTAVEGTDYKIHSAIVHAGKYNDSILLIVYRKPSMQTDEKRLLLEIIPSADFQPGLYNTPASPSDVKQSGGSIRLLVKINDFLTQPANWSMLSSFFGTYSKVKYQFIIDVTGRAEFPYGSATGIPYGQMAAYQNMLRQALSDYVAEHGPMIDENGQTVTF